MPEGRTTGKREVTSDDGEPDRQVSCHDLPVRILLTIHGEHTADAGAPGVTLRLAEAYRRRGHDASVLSFSDLPDRWPLQAKQLVFPHLVAHRVAQRARAADGIDVLDASTGDAWLHASLARRRRTSWSAPLIVTRSHGLEHSLDREVRQAARAGGAELSWKYPLYTGGLRLREVGRSLRLADLSLLLNQADHDLAVQRLGVAPERAVIVRNGIPAAFQGLPGPEPIRATAPLRIAVVGAYTERKGIRTAAAALGPLLARHPDWSVSFLGTGCPAEEVHTDYPAAVSRQITVVAHYANTDLPGLLAGHQVHLFPTLSEGGPIALLETMACGLAPVVSAVPGPVEVVRDGVNGLLVPPSDPAAVEQALELLDSQPELLHAVRRSAHADAQRYAWQQIADEQLAVFEELLRRHQSAR